MHLQTILGNVREYSFPDFASHSLRNNFARSEKSDIFSNKFQTLIALSNDRIDKFSSNFDYKTRLKNTLLKYTNLPKKTFNPNLQILSIFDIVPSSTIPLCEFLFLIPEEICKFPPPRIPFVPLFSNSCINHRKLHVHKGVVGEGDRIRDDPRE